MSLAMRGYLEVASEIRRRKRQMDILIMPTVVKKMILQTIASCGSQIGNGHMFRRRGVRTLLNV
jgi:hypothetical protein